VLDVQLHHNGLTALHVKHRNIERDLEQPEVRQRFKEAAINYRELRIGFEKSLDMVWVVVTLERRSDFAASRSHRKGHCPADQ